MSQCHIKRVAFYVARRVFQVHKLLNGPLLLFAFRRAECTPADAVFCDDGLSCQSGMTGYTCGEIPEAPGVPGVV